MAAWRKANVPSCALDGAGSKGAEEAAADVCDEWAQLGYAGTLDFSVCYDNMHPEVTCEVMKRAGWPADIVDLMQDMCGNQERWIYGMAMLTP